MIELLFSVFRIFCRIGTSDMQIECDNADIHWMRQILQATYNHVLFSAHLNLCYQVSQLYIKWTHPSALVLPRHLFTRTSDSYPETFGSCWCWFFFIDISQQKKKRVNGFIMLHLFPKSKRNMERKRGDFAAATVVHWLTHKRALDFDVFFPFLIVVQKHPSGGGQMMLSTTIIFSGGGQWKGKERSHGIPLRDICHSAGA